MGKGRVQVRVKGRLSVCDRCRKTEFEELTGKDYFDGGYTEVDKFENNTLGWNHVAGKLLCKKCNTEWNELFRNFMEAYND